MPNAKTKKKILVAEDEAMISTMYKTRLEADGFEVLLASNGSEALAIAEKEKPDLILLDVIMPQLDGFAVLDKIKGDPKTKKTPILLITNLGTDEDKKKGEAKGAADYIVKANFTPDQISEKVKKYLT